MPFVALCMAVLGASLLGVLLLNTSMAQGEYERYGLATRLAQSAQQQQELVTELDQAAAPARLAQRAKALGMVPVDHGRLPASVGRRRPGRPDPGGSRMSPTDGGRRTDAPRRTATVRGSSTPARAPARQPADAATRRSGGAGARRTPADTATRRAPGPHRHPSRPCRVHLRRPVPVRARVARADRPQRRHAWLLAGILLALTGFVVRLVYVQGLDASPVAAEALEKRLTSVTIPGDRGRILDAGGVVLATSVERYNIEANPKEVAKWKDEQGRRRRRGRPAGPAARRGGTGARRPAGT